MSLLRLELFIFFDKFQPDIKVIILEYCEIELASFVIKVKSCEKKQ